MSGLTLDLAALALIAALAVHGAIRGAVRGAVMLVALVAASVLAGRYSAAVGASEWPVIAELADARDVGYMTGWVVVFVAVLLLGVVVGWLLRKIVESADLGALDRMLGAVVGALKGALVVALVTVGMMVVDMPSLRAAASDSYALAGTREIFGAVESHLPADVAQWLGERLGTEPPPR